MIISCPTCQTQFRVDEARLVPEGKKVRCSKCGHVWLAMANGQATPDAPSAEKSGPDVAPETTPEVEPPAPEAAERAEPVLSARDTIDGEDDDGESAAQETGGAESSEGGDSGAKGVTDDQRAKLAAARQQKPRSRFWIKVFMILLIIAGLLLLAYRNLPPEILDKINPVIQLPADVGEVETKPVPAEPAKGGHIVGGEPPAQPAPQ